MLAVSEIGEGCLSDLWQALCHNVKSLKVKEDGGFASKEQGRTVPAVGRQHRISIPKLGRFWPAATLPSRHIGR